MTASGHLKKEVNSRIVLCFNNSVQTNLLNMFQQLEATPLRVVIPGLSLWNSSIMVPRTRANVYTQRLTWVIFITVESSLIYDVGFTPC